MSEKGNLTGLRAYAYLRKSRMEEGMDTETVLRRHREALEECAAEHGLSIQAYFPEVVSGESLYARPQMLRLLEAVEKGECGAVLCMDLDRLSRGRMKDQGMILDAFKDSGTLIVTPEKIYDLSDEIDDELAEFKTFMSRREYKIINKRLRRGLQRSIREGCYIANAPYGYRKTAVGRRPTLEIFEPEAKFVRVMFQLYASGYGCTSIAGQVNAMGARPHRSSAFSRNSVAKILRNPVYIGKIVWDQKTHVKKNAGGTVKRLTVSNPPEKWTVAEGLHPPIIEKELFDRVQEIIAGRCRPGTHDGSVRNPLAGLVRCGVCGGPMQRMTLKGEAYLLCPRKGCCAAAKFALAEGRVLRHLEDLLAGMEPALSSGRSDLPLLETAISDISASLSAAQRQKIRLHELLELGEYDLPTYRARMEAVTEKLSELERQREEARLRLEQALQSQSEKVQSVLDAYRTSDAAQKNALLHSVIEQITYYKEKKSRPADFQLEFILKPG